MRQSWKKRWVMLSGKLIYYFENESSKDPAGIISLDGAMAQVSKQMQFRSAPECLVIKTKTARVFYFEGSAADNEKWLNALRSVEGVSIAASTAKNIGDLSAGDDVEGDAAAASAPTAEAKPEADADAHVGAEFGVTHAIANAIAALPHGAGAVWERVRVGARRRERKRGGAARARAAE